jgi:hypothetical protein
MTDAVLSAADDPRWRVFNEKGFACSCGQTHVGLFPINMLYPIGWPGSKDYEPDSALRMDGNFLSANFCVLEGKYFCMRMRLPVNIRGADSWAFTCTVWASLDRPDFEGYVEALKDGKLRDNARTHARLINRLSGYPDTAMLVGTAFQQANGALPVLIIHGPQPNNSPDNPLLEEQRQGIGVDRMLELFALYNHDMRAAAGR